MPNKMKMLRSALGLSDVTAWQDVKSEMLKGGSKVKAGDILFVKIEDDKIQVQLEKLNSGSLTSPTMDEKAGFSPISDEIEFDQFLPIDLRAAKIISAEPVPKSDKLLKFTLDLGIENRTILSGVAKHLSPDQLIGKTVVIVSNLKPRMMMGVESQGMVLFAEEPDGTLKPVLTDALPGSNVK
jgi:methionyl-tRNA synthetase